MTKKYIDADKLKAEIKGKIAEIEKEPAPADRETILLQMCKTNAFREILSVINRIGKNTLQQEQREQPIRGYDEAYLNDCIAKAKKSWEGVDVDKFMDEVRGREPDVDLEKALNSLDDAYFDLGGIAVKGATYYLTVEDLKDIARHFYELGKNSK